MRQLVNGALLSKPPFVVPENLMAGAVDCTDDPAARSPLPGNLCLCDVLVFALSPTSRSYGYSERLCDSGRRGVEQAEFMGWLSGIGKLSPAPRRLTSTSTTSTPITVGSRNGCAASTASPPRTCPTIWDGDARSRHGATKQHDKTGSSALSASGHINSKHDKSLILHLSHVSVRVCCLYRDINFSSFLKVRPESL